MSWRRGSVPRVPERTRSERLGGPHGAVDHVYLLFRRVRKELRSSFVTIAVATNEAPVAGS